MLFHRCSIPARHPKIHARAPLKLSIGPGDFDCQQTGTAEKKNWKGRAAIRMENSLQELQRDTNPCVALKGESSMHELIAELLNNDKNKNFRLLSMQLSSPVMGRKVAAEKKSR
jgi:hypothetical protein